MNHQDIQAILEKLAHKYPPFFQNSKDAKPLAKGVFEQIDCEALGISKTQLRKALGFYCRGFYYLMATANDKARWNLDKTLASEITKDERQYAIDILKQRKQKKAEKQNTAKPKTDTPTKDC